MIRTALLTGFATLALFSAPAMADGIAPMGQPMMHPFAPKMAAPLVKPMGMPFAGAGLASTNVNNATNIAAGIGNKANQQAATMQSGSPFGALVSTNVNTATNVAAGIGNTANQQMLAHQGHGVRVGLDFSGRGPLVSTNVNVATNVAAGIGNAAGQQLMGVQR